MSDIRDLIKRIDRTLEAIKCCDKGGSASNIDFTPLINKLEELNQNIQDIEVTADNISITSDQINLNTAELQSILTQTQAINANTDNIEFQLNDLITKVQAGNVTLTDIKNVLNTSILPQLQAINANTDQVETLIGQTNAKLDILSGNTDQIEPLLQQLIDILTPQTNVFKKAFTVGVNSGDKLDAVIASAFNNVDLTKIRSISVSAIQNDVRVDTFDSVIELNISTGSLFTWNEGTKDFINFQSLQNFIFKNTGIITVSFEEII